MKDDRSSRTLRPGGFGDPRTFFGRLLGQEKNLTTAAVARMNLFLHGIEDFVVERGDTLRVPVFSDPGSGGLASFDVVVANPPFSLEQWGREIWESDPWGAPSRAAHGFERRLRLGTAHGQVHGRPDRSHGGRAAPGRAVPWRRRGRHPTLPAREGSRRGGDRSGAEPLLRHRAGRVRARAAPPQGRQAPKKVLAVDASALFRKGARRSSSSRARKPDPQVGGGLQGRARSRSRGRLQEIEKEGWTLNISRYVVPPVGEDIPPLHEAVAAFKQHSDAATRPKITCAA